MRITKRGLTLGLAVVWLLDAALQFQPYMFSRAFATDTLGGVAGGNPAAVSAPVNWVGHIVEHHPVPTNAVFAVVQLAIALGLLWRPTVRAALAASVAWSLLVWWLGEGLGGLLLGTSTLLNGAPGAVLLYAVLAVVLWPRRGEADSAPPGQAAALAWTGTWLLFAVLQLLPQDRSGSAVSGVFADDASSAPHWLAVPAGHIASTIGDNGAYVVAIVVVAVLLALAALVPGLPRRAAAVGGGLLALVIWAFAQDFGNIFSGSSTDPNSGPLLILMAVALAGAAGQRFAVGGVITPYGAPASARRTNLITTDLRTHHPVVDNPVNDQVRTPAAYSL